MKILLGRTYLGFGDWVMMTQILLMTNKHRPDVEIHLQANPFVPDNLLQLATMCGVRLKLVDMKVPPSAFQGYIKHVIYDNVRPPDGEHLLTNMLRCFNKQLGLDVPLDWSCWAVPVIHREVCLPTDGDYALMSSSGSPSPHSTPKHYPYLDEISERISKELMPVIQVGSKNDPPLKGACGRFNDLTWPELSYLFKCAKLGVWLENGLAHWAANHRLPSYVLICSHAHPRGISVTYPSTICIDAYRDQPGYRADAVWQKMLDNPLPR